MNKQLFSYPGPRALSLKSPVLKLRSYAPGLLLFVFLVTSCSTHTSSTESYTRDSDGYYYKLFVIGDGNESPRRGDVLLLDAIFKTQKDSVIWDSSVEGNNAFYLSLEDSILKGSFNKHLLSMVEGDSMAFYIPTAIFFKQYFHTPPPAFCSGDSMVKAGVKLLEIMNQAEYAQVLQEAQQEQEDKELKELQQIDNYLKVHQLPQQVSSDGIYYIGKSESSGEPVKSGKTVVLDYRGSFLNGRSIDISKKSMEFVYGTPDQLIKGLNIVIGGMKKGENAKIIVPSRLAFGEHGSANGSIPPYSPLLYDIKITDVK